MTRSGCIIVKYNVDGHVDYQFDFGFKGQGHSDLELTYSKTITISDHYVEHTRVKGHET